MHLFSLVPTFAEEETIAFSLIFDFNFIPKSGYKPMEKLYSAEHLNSW